MVLSTQNPSYCHTLPAVIWSFTWNWHCSLCFFVWTFWAYVLFVTRYQTPRTHFYSGFEVERRYLLQLILQQCSWKPRDFFQFFCTYYLIDIVVKTCKFIIDLDNASDLNILCFQEWDKKRQRKSKRERPPSFVLIDVIVNGRASKIHIQTYWFLFVYRQCFIITHLCSPFFLIFSR